MRAVVFTVRLVASVPALVMPVVRKPSTSGHQAWEALDAAIAAALEAVPPADAAGWFAHGGYPTRQAA